jgi:hypothetical protein
MISLTDISLYSILLPSGMVFFSWKIKDTPLTIISVLILFTLLIEVFSEFYISDLYQPNHRKNNMFLYHIFTFCEGILLTLYFRTFFQQKWIRNMLVLLLTLFSLLVLLNIKLWEPLDHYPSIPRMVECILMMILSIIFFMNVFQQSTVTNLIEYPHFWLVSGLLLYFAGTFFMNLVGQIVLDRKKLGFDVYDIHSFLNIFLNIIYTIALWMSSRRLISAQ